MLISELQGGPQLLLLREKKNLQRLFDDKNSKKSQFQISLKLVLRRIEVSLGEGR